MSYCSKLTIVRAPVSLTISIASPRPLGSCSTQISLGASTSCSYSTCCLPVEMVMIPQVVVMVLQMDLAVIREVEVIQEVTVTTAHLV